MKKLVSDINKYYTLIEEDNDENQKLDPESFSFNQVKVFFKPPFGIPITIRVNEYSTFKDVKDEIYKLRGIPPNQQQILLHGINNSNLEDNFLVLKKMGVYGSARLIIPQDITKKLYIKPQNTDPFLIYVEDKVSIKDIKYEVINKLFNRLNCINFNIQPRDYEERCDLMFAGVRLENNKAIKDYIIPENATLDFLIYKRQGIIIFIKDISKKYIPLEVRIQDSVFDLKKQIEDLNGIPANQQVLYFEDQMLLDQNQLQYYRIFPFSTIELKPQIQVLLKFPSTDQISTINVDPNADIKTLKHLIESTIGLKMSDQILIFQCKQLEDNFSLKDYSITNDALILVVPFQREIIRITVAMKGFTMLILKATPTDFIKEFKLKIKEKTDFPVEKQVLVSKHTILNDENSFQFYNITHDITINLLIIERGGFFVFYKISPKNYAPIEVTKDDTSSYIKNEMQKKRRNTNHQQRI